MKKYLIFGLLLTVTWSMNAQKKELRAVSKALGKANFEQAATALAAAEALMSSMDEKQKGQFYFYKSKLLFKGGAAELEDVNKSIDAFAKIGSSVSSEEKNTHFQNLINHLINQGSASIDKSDFATASDYFSNAYKLSSKDTIYLYYAASSAVNAKDYDKSLAMYEKLRALGFTGIEKQYFAVNKETNKEEAFDSEVLRDVSVKSKSHINPTDKNSKSRYPEIIKNMALIYNERGETDKALDAMREARAQNPDDLNLILTEANVHYAMGNIEKFKELLEYATERDPNNSELQYNLGVIAAEAKDIENAKKYYERAIALKPDYVNAYINLAVVILDPEVKIINEMNSLIDCNRASCFDRYDNLKIQKRKLYIEAIPLIEKALEFNPNSLPLLKKMAEMLPAVERYDDEKKYKELIKSLEQ